MSDMAEWAESKRASRPEDCECNGWCDCHMPGWPAGEPCDCDTAIMQRFGTPNKLAADREIGATDVRTEV